MTIAATSKIRKSRDRLGRPLGLLKPFMNSREKRAFINFALTLSPQDRRMVVRTRLRSIVLPIVLYLVLGVASVYLVWGASNGEHGLKAAAKFDADADRAQSSTRRT